MDPFSFKADLEQQAAQEFANITHAPIFRTLGRSSRLMVWNLMHNIQRVIQMLARSLRQMDNAARQQRETSREGLIDNRNP
jgi:hypothetical protein